MYDNCDGVYLESQKQRAMIILQKHVKENKLKIHIINKKKRKTWKI